MFPPETKVLIVDDMKTMRKIVKKACSTIGFSNFVEAEDGDLAWKALNEDNGIGLVISDWNMPNCSGLEFLKRVRADSGLKGTPFMLLTAESEADQVKDAIAAGVDNYLVKPFDVESLRGKLEAIHKKLASAS